MDHYLIIMFGVFNKDYLASMYFLKY